MSTARPNSNIAGLRRAVLGVAVLAFTVAFVTWAWLPAPHVRGIAALIAACGFATTLVLDNVAKRRLRHG